MGDVVGGRSALDLGSLRAATGSTHGRCPPRHTGGCTDPYSGARAIPSAVCCGKTEPARPGRSGWPPPSNAHPSARSCLRAGRQTTLYNCARDRAAQRAFCAAPRLLCGRLGWSKCRSRWVRPANWTPDVAGQALYPTTKERFRNNRNKRADDKKLRNTRKPRRIRCACLGAQSTKMQNPPALPGDWRSLTHTCR